QADDVTRLPVMLSSVKGRFEMLLDRTPCDVRSGKQWTLTGHDHSLESAPAQQLGGRAQRYVLESRAGFDATCRSLSRSAGPPTRDLFGPAVVPCKRRSPALLKEIRNKRLYCIPRLKYGVIVSSSWLCGHFAILLFLLYRATEVPNTSDIQEVPEQRYRSWRRQTVRIPISGQELRSNLPDQLYPLIDICRQLQEQGELLITFVNEAYLPFMYNFLCHTAYFGVSGRMVVLVDGFSARRKLERHWPGVHVLSVSDVTASEDESFGSLHPGNLTYGTAGYVRMMAHRTKILNVLLQYGFSFFLFEADFVWLANPLPDFLQYGKKHELDFVGTISSDPLEDNICGAFIYFRNTVRTRTVWERVTKQVEILEDVVSLLEDSEKAPPREHEQIYLNALLKKRYFGVRYGAVDYTTVMDGRWYQMPRESQRVLKVKAIHNNFAIGNEEKMKRARDAGHWVLNDDLRCNSSKVAALKE
ncbi:hypothetical protein BaRGS_00005881, partial [Batillaria attramentaria]